MTRPRLEACYFDAAGDGRWERLARVLRATAAAQCPTWIVHVHPIAPKLLERGKRSEATNTAKLAYWNDLVQRAPDGDRVLLIDSDTFIVRPLDPVWAREFDVAYTVRASLFPLNGGVVFVRVSAMVRAFFQAWLAEDLRLLEDRADQPQPWRQQYGGINQAALAATLSTDHGLAIAKLPCAEWNAEDSSWASFDPAVARIVHVKSALRLACLDSQPIPPELAALAALWRGLDRASRSAALELVS